MAGATSTPSLGVQLGGRLAAVGWSWVAPPPRTTSSASLRDVRRHDAGSSQSPQAWHVSRAIPTSTAASLPETAPCGLQQQGGWGVTLLWRLLFRSRVRAGDAGHSPCGAKAEGGGRDPAVGVVLALVMRAWPIAHPPTRRRCMSVGPASTASCTPSALTATRSAPCWSRVGLAPQPSTGLAAGPPRPASLRGHRGRHRRSGGPPTCSPEWPLLVPGPMPSIVDRPR